MFPAEAEPGDARSSLDCKQLSFGGLFSAILLTFGDLLVILLFIMASTHGAEVLSSFC